MKKLILILLSLFFISCSTDDKDEYKNDQSFYKNNTLEDYELFNKSRNYITTNQLELALIELDKIEVLFPSSPYANKSMLMRAYIHFLSEDYEKILSRKQRYSLCELSRCNDILCFNKKNKL